MVIDPDHLFMESHDDALLAGSVRESDFEDILSFRRPRSEP